MGTKIKIYRLRHFGVWEKYVLARSMREAIRKARESARAEGLTRHGSEPTGVELVADAVVGAE